MNSKCYDLIPKKCPVNIIHIKGTSLCQTNKPRGVGGLSLLLLRVRPTLQSSLNMRYGKDS